MVKDARPVLAGDAIPLESRMLGLVATFQQYLAELRYEKDADAPEDPLLDLALGRCQHQAGDRWDPKLVENAQPDGQGLAAGVKFTHLTRQDYPGSRSAGS